MEKVEVLEVENDSKFLNAADTRQASITARTPDGIPVQSFSSLTVGKNGPILEQDAHTLQYLQNFARQNQAVRNVHEKAIGFHGHFEVPADIKPITDICYAKVFEAGKKTPGFFRFSSSNEVRGADNSSVFKTLSYKLYTEEGNWDMTTLGVAVYPNNEPAQIMHFFRCKDPNPRTRRVDQNMSWDFLTHFPETTSTVMEFYGDRNSPTDFRHMSTFAIHTFKLVNRHGKHVYCRFKLATNQGEKFMTEDETHARQKEEPDFQTKDIIDAVNRGEFPSWTLCIQTMTDKQIVRYRNPDTGERWDAFDITKAWSEKDYPLRKVGVLTLTALPLNHYNETTQVAYNPGRLVPGIEIPYQDNVLQARELIYADAELHRNGINSGQLPINYPNGVCEQMYTYYREGFMNGETVNGGAPQYYPNSFLGPRVQEPITDRGHPGFVSGVLGRREDATPPDPYGYARILWKEMGEDERKRFVDRFKAAAIHADEAVQWNIINQYENVSPDLAMRLQRAFQL